ncbi:MAG: outer membrane beta-barrel protein [Mucilaginibacter sp.]|nr:outer membrane beta-barrel protein [Mucilaginibacter sp.]
MKKCIFLIAAFVLATVASNAQTEKGSQTLGASLGFDYNKTGGVYISPYDNSITPAGGKTTSFNIGPSYSYFIADKLDLGVSLSYGQSNTTYTNTPIYPEKQSSYAFISSIYLRKYYMFGDKLGLRTGPYFGYEKGDSKSTYLGSNALNSEDSKYDEYSAGARLEFVYYPSKKLGFAAYVASIDWYYVKFDNGNFGNTSTDNVDLSLVNKGLTLSVFYSFGSK